MAAWDDDDYHDPITIHELEKTRYYHLYFQDKPKLNGFYEYMGKHNDIDGNQYTFARLEPGKLGIETLDIPEKNFEKNKIRIYPRQYNGIARSAQSVRRSVKRSVKRSVRRSVKRSVRRSVKRSVRRSVRRSKR